MRLVYWVRVALVSWEALILLLALLAWTTLRSQLAVLAGGLALNEHLLKYLLILPIALGVWVANEVRLLMHEDRETTKLLLAWPEYWKLKVHVWVALLYALVFAILSVIPWVAKSGIGLPGGLLLFTASIGGQLVVAGSVYIARLQVKEFVARAA